MQQVIGLLSLGGTDLLAAIAEKAADNPALDISLPADAARATVAHDPEAAVTLVDHIRAQLPFLLTRAEDAPIAEALIGGLDARGFVAVPLSQIAQECRIPAHRVETVLDALQCCDPTGLFARSLAECLALQLRDRGQMSSEMALMLQRLEWIAQGKLTELAAHCGVDQQALGVMIARIRALDPRPAAGFHCAPLHLRVPDLLVRPGDDGWNVALHPDAQPKLRLLAINDTHAPWQHREARQLQRALAMRNRTVLGLGRFVIEHQQDFLADADACLRPLTRLMAARALGVHGSTIGRIVAHCAMQTPRGIMPLHAFFSAATGAADKGADVTAQGCGPVAPQRGKPSRTCRISRQGQPPQAGPDAVNWPESWGRFVDRCRAGPDA